MALPPASAWPLCDAFTNDLLIRSVERHDFE
jgi:hypothetical protein